MIARKFASIQRRVLCGTAAIVVALLSLAGVLGTPGSVGAAGTRAAPLLAAEYFGIANPINLWSSDLSGAPATFRQIKTDGFNAVALVLPWGFFEPKISPPQFNPTAFARLNTLITTADRLGLKVVLRLGYDWDLFPGDQQPGGDRFIAAFGEDRINRVWLGYIQKIRDDVAKFHNIAAHYISWEDLWFPVFLAQSAPNDASRLQTADTTGYRTWLQHTYTLGDVSSAYGTQFSNWSQVPTPPPQSPSFELMYKYNEWALINKFFLPAQRVYPGLTVETRVDADPIYNGSRVIGSYVYNQMYQLPGTSVTGMYFSPYQGDPSTALAETASDGIAALQTTLSTMSSRSGGRPLYIYEYEIVSNSPQVSQDPSLTPSEVPPFLEQSPPLLEKYTSGFALWTYRDFTMSAIYNPSFSLGTAGWQTSGDTKVTNRSNSASFLTLQPGSTASQVAQFGQVPLTPDVPVQLAFQASPATGQSGSLSVTVGGAPAQAVTLHPGWQTYTVQIPQAQLGTARVSFATTGPVHLTNVQLFNFTQLGDVYNTAGAPETGAAPLRAMNQRLISGS